MTSLLDRKAGAAAVDPDDYNAVVDALNTLQATVAAINLAASPIETAELVLTNAQIKTLLTPVTLVAVEDASHVPILSDVAIVLDDSHGVYVDPNAGFNFKIGYGPDPTDPATVIMDNLAVADAVMGAPGPGVYSFWAGPQGFTAFAAGFYWGARIGQGFGAVATPATAIMVGKDGANNFTGGGTGNTLTIRVQYSQIEVVV